VQYDSAIRGVFTASLATKAIVLLLEAEEKRRYLNSYDRQRGPEETSGIFSQSVFWWLNVLIKRGFSKVLLMDDLYPIDEYMMSERLGACFRQKWKACEFLQSCTSPI
jgi:ATP-binding cassette subfamily C (CFTR/MRP) protein 1